MIGRNISAYLLANAEDRVRFLQMAIAICPPQDRRRLEQLRERLVEAERGLDFTREMVERDQANG